MNRKILIIIIVVLIAATGIWYSYDQLTKKKALDAVDLDKQTGNFSMSGVVNKVASDQFNFTTAIIENTPTGTKRVEQDKLVKLSAKTQYFIIDNQNKQFPARLSDVKVGVRVTVFISSNPFHASEITADRVNIQ